VAAPKAATTGVARAAPSSASGVELVLFLCMLLYLHVCIVCDIIIIIIIINNNNFTVVAGANGAIVELGQLQRCRI
jgi:hypothetical protein